MNCVKMNNETATIAIEGKFDVCACVALRDEMSEAFNNGCTKIEVDFVNTTFIDSSGIGILVEFQRRVNGNIYAKNLKGMVLGMFKTTCLLEDFHVK